jgi:hypothetical protein
MVRAWTRDQTFGAELADLTLNGGTLSTTFVAISSEPCPYRLDSSRVPCSMHLLTSS